MPDAPKIFTSTSDQIQKQLSRGLQITNDISTQKIIESENYYKLFNGYKWLFLDSNYTGPDEKYIAGTKFEEIYALYLFDRELKNIFIRYILEIENNVKSVLAHDFSQKYGHDFSLHTEIRICSSMGSGKHTDLRNYQYLLYKFKTTGSK